jgi:proliferating cell nuclear antigen PCNA
MSIQSEDNMNSVFKSKTNEAYLIKVLAELLTNNLKLGCFILDNNGIKLTQFDHHRYTLVDMNLDAENFSIYKYKKAEKTQLGLNLNHFHRMLKSIKKKDSLQLFILENDPNELGIKTIPKENNRVTTSGIKIQNIQNLDVILPEGYSNNPIIVSSSEFQKMCKDLCNIGSPNISVTAKNFSIQFVADADGILKRKVILGETMSAEEDNDMDNNQHNYHATFSNEQFSRITKLAGLSSNLQIFTATEDMPILFRSNIGSLGKISIYVKSNEIIENESNYNDNSELNMI